MDTARSKCYLDIAIDGRQCKRVVLELFNDKCPKTCENFRCLCTGEKGVGKKSNKPLHYKGSKFHRIIRNFMIQGGDITDGNGRGGDSIYEGPFDDENLTIKHDKPYLLSMANKGPNTNQSQFFITTNKAPHLDGKSVVFGRVKSGHETIDRIEELDVEAKSYRPKSAVIIIDCGEPDASSSPHHELPDRDKNILRKEQIKKEPLRYRDSRSRRRYSTSSNSSSSSDSSANHVARKRRRSSSQSSSDSSSSSDDCQSCASSSDSYTSSSDSHTSSSGSSCSTCSSGSSSDSDSSDSSSSSEHSSISGSSSNSYDSRMSSARKQPRNKVSKSVVKLEEPGVKQEPMKSDDDQSVIIEDSNAREDELEQDTYVNPHYKCSVRKDEIPPVPTNRFLLREQTNRAASKRSVSDTEDTVDPAFANVDLSKFEDVEDNDEPEKEQDPSQQKFSSRGLKSKLKPEVDPHVTKSGRILKGRGTFRYRTPSPEDERHRRSPSPYRRRRYYDRNRSRYSRSRTISRSRSRSPVYVH